MKDQICPSYKCPVCDFFTCECDTHSGRYAALVEDKELEVYFDILSEVISDIKNEAIPKFVNWELCVEAAMNQSSGCHVWKKFVVNNLDMYEDFIDDLCVYDFATPSKEELRNFALQLFKRLEEVQNYMNY